VADLCERRGLRVRSGIVPRILLLAAVIIWGWTFIATKILVAELGPVEILSLRLLIGLPFLAGVVVLRRAPMRFGREDAVPILLGGTIFAFHLIIQISGLLTATAVNTSWIITVSPLATAVLSFLLLRERLTRGTVAGIGIATIGVLLLVSRGRLTDLAWLQSTGDWLILASAHTWAFYTIATRNLARRRDPLAVTFAVMLVAGLWAAVLFPLFGDVSRIRAMSMNGLLALLYLAIPGGALGQWFWQEGVARVGATRAGLYLYLEPIATLALAVPMLGEPFGMWVAIGGGLVLAGVYVGQRGRS